MWTDVTEGRFPTALNVKTVRESIIMPFLKEKGFKMPKEPDAYDPKFQEVGPLFEGSVRGIKFVHKLPESSDWHYAGKDATFGDADTPVFWYRPEGSQTYRVIYGDLSLKDVAPENLPK